MEPYGCRCSINVRLAIPDKLKKLEYWVMSVVMLFPIYVPSPTSIDIFPNKLNSQRKKIKTLVVGYETNK